jgi:hypothetical protein
MDQYKCQYEDRSPIHTTDSVQEPHDVRDRVALMISRSSSTTTAPYSCCTRSEKVSLLEGHQDRPRRGR